MSRIGRQIVAIPSGVEISQGGGELRVKGPKGELSERVPEIIDVEISGGEAKVTRRDDKKFSKSAHGLVRALLANMVQGVTSGFAKELEIQGVGYRAEASGKSLKLSLGFSQPVDVPIPEGLSVSIQENNRVRVEGVSKHAVGQFAAEIRGLRPPEPYKGKGVRYVDEHVRRKVGKAGAA
ncbi:MAG: 50S ribosomal protein L6 [Myxococcales bacterium]|nr:50S ribosomal protein L6 [Myxococcales bacterium]